MTKNEREEREYKSLFSDERYAKKAWRSLIGVSLEGSGPKLPTMIDPKSGEPLYQSIIDGQAYDLVKTRLMSEGKSREPMQAELIVECGILRARSDNQMFNTILERTAGKVKDELSVVTSPFEELSDDELEALANYRKAAAAALEGEANGKDAQ